MEQEYHAYARLVRNLAVSLYRAASVDDHARVMEVAAQLAEESAKRMKSLEDGTPPETPEEYDLGRLREEYGGEAAP
jgi:hypothetical protein